MKKTILFASALLLFAAVAPALGQDASKAAADAAMEFAKAPSQDAKKDAPKYWSESARFDLGFARTGFQDWAAGGDKTITLAAAVDLQANYAKKLMKWNNRLQMDYGFLWTEEKKDLIQKNADRLYFESTWGYKTAAESKFSYSAAFDFKSQFTETYSGYTKDEVSGKWEGQTLKSNFISPAYTNIALGIDWAPAKWFNANISPLTGGFTICTDERLRPNYGMALVEGKEDEYKSALFQFGAQVKGNFKFSINDNFTYETQLVVFTDYLAEPYFRINWDQAINWQLAKYVKFAFKTWMISDPNVMIVDKNGKEKKGPVQFKDYVSFSFTYSLAHKR